MTKVLVFCMVGLPLIHASGPWKPGDRSNQDCFAEWTMPNGKYLSEFSGKMNVPKQPKENHDGPPMAWWPAMWGKTFMQPCLLWVGDRGWRMVNQFWYCRKNAGWSCSKHGNDPTVNDCAKVDYCNEQTDLGITIGGTINWYMRLISKPTGNVTATGGGKYVYELGITSPTGSSLKMFGYMTEPGTKAVGLSCENQPDYTIAQYKSFAPQTPIEVWDMVIKDQDGKVLKPEWSCKDKKGIKLNCNWSDGGRKGIQASFPSADSPKPASPAPVPPSPPSPPSPSPQLPPAAPSECGTCRVCFNAANHQCQADGADRPKTEAACSAKGHIWCGPSISEAFV